MGEVVVEESPTNGNLASNNTVEAQPPANENEPDNNTVEEQPPATESEPNDDQNSEVEDSREEPTELDSIIELSQEYDDTDDSLYEPATDGTIAEIQRRSERNIDRPDYRDYSLCVNSKQTQDPLTVKDAMSRPDAHLWEAAMEEEMTSLMANNT